MLRSLMAKLKFLTILFPQTITGDTNCTSVDTKAFGSSCQLVHVGTPAADFDGSNYIAIEVEHSDDNSTWSDVGAADLFEPEDGASGTQKILDATADKEKIYPVFYLGSKRYWRIVLNETGIVSVAIGISAVNGHPELQPQN